MAEAALRWPLGIGLCFLNLVLALAGFIMQRKAHILEEQQNLKSDIGISPSRISPRQLLYIGIFLYVIAALPDVVSYTLVPQVVCSTVACFRLVVLTILAHFFLHERMRCREIFGMTLCTGGTAACIIFGPRPTDFSAAIADEFYHTHVAVYLIVGLSILAILLVVQHFDALPFCRGCVSENVYVFTLPATAGLACAFGKVFNTEIGFLELPEGFPLGLVKHPRWTSMLLAIVVLGLLDFYMNIRGAKHMPVQVFAPLTFALCTSLQFLQSVFIFGELQGLSRVNATLSILGACLSLLGALVIQPPKLWLLGRELVDDEDVDKTQNQEKLGLGGIASATPMLQPV